MKREETFAAQLSEEEEALFDRENEEETEYDAQEYQEEPAKTKEDAAARETLERLCKQYAALGPEDQGRKKALEGQIFMLACNKLFPRYMDFMGAFFEKDWRLFDPSKGGAYGFFAKRLKYRMQDEQRDVARRGKHIVQDTEPTEDDERPSLVESLPDRSSDPQELIEMDDTVREFLSIGLNMPGLQGRSGNQVRRNYYRMFFTDNVVCGIKKGSDRQVRSFARRERDLFRAVKVEFLDFFMKKQCRSVTDICLSPLKPYGALVEGRNMEETRIPLPGDVYISYLGRVENTKVGPSAVSQQKKMYEEYVKNILGTRSDP